MARHRSDMLSRGVRRDMDLKLIPDERCLTAECLADLRELRSVVDVVLAQLPQKYAVVIRLLYGLHQNKPPLSSSEAARVLHCSTERIVCLRCMAITRLAARFVNELRTFAPVYENSPYSKTGFGK